MPDVTTSTTVADAIEDTRRLLYAMHNGEYNRLAAGIDVDDEDLSFDFDTDGITQGVTIAIDDELLYVWSSAPAARTAVVQRAWDGSVAAAHDASSIVEVSPRFPRFSIRDALLAEIRSWGDQLYATDTYQVSAGSSTSAFDLPIDPFIDVVDVRRSSSSTGRWPRVTNYALDRNANQDDFSSGIALYVQDSLSESTTLQVVYTKPFVLDYFDDGIDLIDDVGLAASMLDIVALGAAWRLLAPREAKRTFTEAQGESRLADEVPPGVTIRAAAGFKALRDQRLVEEADRLARKKAIRW